MKNRYTKDRKRDRIEIVYMFRKELMRLEGRSLKEAGEFCRNHIRPLLSYHEKTNDIDIYLSCKRALLTIIKPNIYG